MQLAILSRNPLPQCLSQLPPHWHALALRAHHPSIDISNTLILEHHPISSVHRTLRTAATLNRLETLSLDGVTLPAERDGDPCLRALGGITTLTALSLRDVGLRHPRAAALAAVLPAMHNLRSLDLSRNVFPSSVLAPALARCTALHTLNLWDSLSPLPEDRNVLPPLSRALPALGRLTSLAIGQFQLSENRLRSKPHEQPVEEWVGLMASLLRLPHLVDLQLDIFKGLVLLDSIAPVALALAQLTLLSRLRFVVPALMEELPVTVQAAQGAADADEATSPHIREAVEREFGGVFRSLTSLTSLRLDVPLPVYTSRRFRVDYCHVEALLSELTCLESLEVLCLRVQTPSTAMCCPGQICQALAVALPFMPSLRQVQLLHPPLDQRLDDLAEVFVQSSMSGAIADVVAGVVEAALLAPQLCDLHVSVTTARPGHERLLEVLLMATIHLQLSIDLYVVGGVGSDALKSFVPVFPCVAVVVVQPRDGLPLHAQSIAPLWGAASQLAHLHRLKIAARLDGAEDASELASHILRSLPCLPQLADLSCEIESSVLNWQASPALPDIVTCFRGLAKLTHLKFVVEGRSWGAGELHNLSAEVLEACTLLPKLRSLDLGTFRNWPQDLLARLLPPLQLRVLAVVLGSRPRAEGGRSHDDEGHSRDDDLEQRFARMVTDLQHLRCLSINGPKISQFRQVQCIQTATEELPSFQLLF